MKHVIIIAEAGVNHNGDFEMAKQLALKAKEAGADYVKFQTGIPEKVISRYADMAEYQKTNIGHTESQLDMVRKIMLAKDEFAPLKQFCDEIGIKFISTPFDLESIDILTPMDMDFWKIPSGEITNYPYLKKIAQLGMPIIMSTGMSTNEEIENGLNILYANGIRKGQVTLLHCNTEYPTPMKDVNLRAMQQMRDKFGVTVGYSDHTVGIEVPVAAVALGAEVIEKHFTLDKTLPGPDHKASLEPQELKAMVSAIRNIEQALGDGEKHVSESERKNIAIARKSIIAARDIKQGELLTEDNLTTKRPGNGISPMRWNEVVGSKAVRDFKEDELIEL